MLREFQLVLIIKTFSPGISLKAEVSEKQRSKPLPLLPLLIPQLKKSELQSPKDLYSPLCPAISLPDCTDFKTSMVKP